MSAGKEAAREHAAGVIVCLYPDVCDTPKKPVPHFVIADLGTLVNPSPNVKATQMPVAHMKTVVPKTKNDEAGVGGGCVSGVNQGLCRPVEGEAKTVKVNKEFLLRHHTEFEMNCASPTGPGNTKGKLNYATSPPAAGFNPDGSPTCDTNPPVSGPPMGVPAMPNAGIQNLPAPFAMRPTPFTAGLDRTIGAINEGVDQVVGFGEGFVDEGINTVKGLFNLGVGTVKFAGDMVLGGYVEGAGLLFGFDPPSWLPSAMRGNQTASDLGQLGSAIWDNPSLIWDGIKDPYVRDWAAGQYGRAFGRGTFGIVDILVGAKGLTKAGRLGSIASRLGNVDSLADVFRVAQRAGAAIPGEFGKFADELLAIARQEGNIGTLIDAARKADSLDDLLKLGRLTPDEIAALKKAGKLSDLEAAKAQAHYIKAMRDAEGPGAVVAKSPPKIMDDTNPAFRHTSKDPLFRGDRRDMNEVFRDGLNPKDPNAARDLASYQADYSKPSQWVSATQSSEVAQNPIFAGIDRQYFVINPPPGGVDVNRALGIFSRNPMELEIAFSRSIPNTSILGAFNNGVFTRNPFYTGPPLPGFP